jgi:hypothetical protein
MKKISLIAVLIMAVFLVGTFTSVYAAEDWKGITWTDPYGSISIDGDGNLVVEVQLYNDRTDKGTPAPKGEGKAMLGWGAAHYNTPGAFRAATEAWIEVTFMEYGQSNVGAQVWIEDETWGIPGNENHLWIQFGAWEWTPSYGIYLWDAETDDDLFINTHIPRQKGIHTLKIMKNSDETVSFYFDGEFVYQSDSVFTLDYLGDVYLAAHNNWRGAEKADGHNPHNLMDAAIYTDYTTGTS